MNLFDDLLAAACLYVDSWENVADADGIGGAYSLLKDEVRGTETMTSLQRERLFRDAAIREAARRGDDYASIGARYGLSSSAVSAVARAGGERRRIRPAPPVEVLS